MNDILNAMTVLVLNRNWQAVHVKTPAQAFCMMTTDVGTALDIEGQDKLHPVKWEVWRTLPVREGDNAIRTVAGLVRVPTVLVLSSFAKVPMKRPKFSARSIWNRDGGTCQYTGRVLAPDEGNIDHVVPRSRGGATSWENCVLAHKQVNSRKGDRLPEEVGLTLRRAPGVPREMPVTALIRNHHEIPDWSRFLHKRAKAKS